MRKFSILVALRPCQIEWLWAGRNVSAGASAYGMFRSSCVLGPPDGGGQGVDWASRKVFVSRLSMIISSIRVLTIGGAWLASVVFWSNSLRNASMTPSWSSLHCAKRRCANIISYLIFIQMSPVVIKVSDLLLISFDCCCQRAYRFDLRFFFSVSFRALKASVHQIFEDLMILQRCREAADHRTREALIVDGVTLRSNNKIFVVSLVSIVDIVSF